MLAIAAAIAAIVAPAPVQTLAFDTPQLAYASSHSAPDCDRIRVWNRATGRTVRLGRSTSCEETSTGSGIESLSVAGNRVLWLFYAGGNIREWSLFTATTTAPRPRQLRFIARDVDEPAPIVLGEADTTRFGELLPYAVDRQVIVLRPNGSGGFSRKGARSRTGASTCSRTASSGRPGPARPQPRPCSSPGTGSRRSAVARSSSGAGRRHGGGRFLPAPGFVTPRACAPST
jgi:hypothetical protein